MKRIQSKAFGREIDLSGIADFYIYHTSIDFFYSSLVVCVEFFSFLIYSWWEETDQ